MKKLRLILILPIWTIFVIIFSTLSFNNYSDAQIINSKLLKLPDSVIVDTINYDNDTIKKQDSLILLLNDEINEYINNNASKNHLFSKSLIKSAIQYDIDICFIMAQAEQETNFGNTGIGKTKKSMFGVKTKHGYKSYKKCIEEYCKLIRKSYLGKKKTEHDLMNNFITLNGSRYASHNKYESLIKQKYKKIKSTTQIYFLQEKLNELI